MTHLINRLQFEMSCPDEDLAFSFNNNFSVTYQEKIVEVVDSVCSKYVSEEQWLKIDKLEIDLGRFNPYSFETNFAEAFKDKFEKELIRNLAAISPEQKKESRQLSRTELFKYFLQNGILSWWADEGQIDLDEVSMDLVINQTQILKSFFYNQRFKANVWQRTGLQLNHKVKALIVSLMEELKDTKELFIGWIQQLNLIKGGSIDFELKIPDISIDHILLINAPKIFHNAKNKATLLQILQDNIAEIFSDHKVLIEQIIQQNRTVFLKTEEEGLGQGGDNNKLLFEAGINSVKIDSVLNGKTIYPEPQEEEATDKYVVKHAGIILLAPFLKRFFTNLDLLRGVEWQSKEARYRAVHLLRFLSTGLQKTPEYNLTLEKVICGIAIEEPIPIEVLLEEKEINEAEMLLESVIEHWKALKNTSVYGLRETFLKREGLLKKHENGWLLQVECKTLDVLIDSIPWGYSSITFPWSDYLIFVEW